MRGILLICLAMIALPVLAQECTCKDKLQFVRTQIEANYAGFKDKVTAENREEYDAFTAAQMRKATSAIKPAACMMLLQEWLQFFKDGHIQMAGGMVEDGPDAVARRSKKAETVILAEGTIRSLRKKTAGIEGIYTNKDSTYTIAVVENKNEYRDHVGVIVWTRTDTWKPGQVKLELKRAGANKYNAVMYYRDHSARIHQFTYDGKSLGEDWVREGQSKTAAPARPQSQMGTYARQINDHTLYVRLPSFGNDVAAEVDSVIRANEALLKTMPNLVIDLRGNGGGSDFSYSPITPWLYTNPIVRAGAEVKATQDNINAWRTMILDDPNMPNEVKEETRPLIAEMEQNVGRYVSTGNNDTTTMDKVQPNPKKVVVLVDGGCASSAEQFLLMARQSKKVTLMGQHTAGILDYGNMRMSGKSPCADMMLFYATTRSRRIDMGEGIDNVGIQPNVVLAKDRDWVTEAVRYMDGGK